jgi:hypothetical protein
MSRESMSRGFARQFARRFRKHREPGCGQLLGSMLIGALTIGTGCSEDEGLTYSNDVRPLLQDCTTCHRPGAPYGPPPGAATDILNPYGSGGLVVSKNLWKEGHPEIDSPVNNVTPGDPDDSFLIDKISDPPLAGSVGAGSPMPFQPERLTAAEITSLETWIAAGATQSAQFLAEVLPIIGNSGRFSGQPKTDGKCQFCHYASTPNAPDLSDPFGANGLVNVAVSYRAGALRVVPGDAEASFLMTKVKADDASADYGAPMPRRFDRLSTSQVERISQWIEAGAKP